MAEFEPPRDFTRGQSADHSWHEANAVEVVSDAIRRGLHPKGAVELVGESPHPSDPSSTNIEYRVPVVPAIMDHDQATTVTPSSEDAPLDYEDPGDTSEGHEDQSETGHADQ
jgi:hypothetical protein